MIKAERQDKVRQLLEEQGTVSVKEISDALGVSDMTIRRDLEELASLGEIERVHGGARSAQGRPHAMLRHEYSHSEKRTKHAEEKLQIARRAVELIEEGSTIFLGTGTTVEQMASMLPAFRLRIVTNSLSVFNLLEAREDCDLCLVGGMYRRRTAAFCGAQRPRILCVRWVSMRRLSAPTAFWMATCLRLIWMRVVSSSSPLARPTRAT